MTTEQQRTAVTGDRFGFTLAEVLVVMLILGMLMGILMPVIGVVQLKMQAARSKTRIAVIDRGVTSYKLANNMYPGQADFNKWQPPDGATDPLPAGKYTGSQVVAAHLFGYYDPAAADPYHNATESNPGASRTAYCPWQPGMLMHRDSTNTAKRNYLSDDFSTPKPIAYYPSGNGAGKDEFRFSDNSVITGKTDIIFWNYIKDTKYAGGEDRPVNHNDFLLIGPGPDRFYFTEDDVHNWGN